MTKVAIAILAAAALITAALAQVPSPNSPMVPFANPLGPMVPKGFGGPMIAGNGSNGGGGTGHDLLANTGQPIYSVGTTPILVQ